MKPRPFIGLLILDVINWFMFGHELYIYYICQFSIAFCFIMLILNRILSTVVLCGAIRQAVTLTKSRNYKGTLSIPEAGETAETPVKRYRNTGKVPIRTQNQDGCVRTR